MIIMDGDDSCETSILREDKLGVHERKEITWGMEEMRTS
jgi:hypothetical protein